MGSNSSSVEFTAESLQRSLKRALSRPEGSAAVASQIERMAKRTGEIFFDAALALLQSLPDPPPRRRAYAPLFESPAFLRELTRVDRFSRKQLLELCRKLIKIDTFLDVRLARMAPGRYGDVSALTDEAVVRVLDILNEISSGPRLVLILNHLTTHPNHKIAAKATVLTGRRLNNMNWAQSRLTSSDPRLRASVVEALWGRNTDSARQTMWECLKDRNNRVASNALLGLHRLGEARVDQLATDMLEDPRPHFRLAAACAMGRMAKPDFVKPLRGALEDPVSGVRLAAKRAIAAIERAITPLEPADAVPSMAPPEEAVAETREQSKSPESPPELEPEQQSVEDEFSFSFDGSYRNRK